MRSSPSVPPHPFWSRVEQVVDFSFADKLCAPLYSPKVQRPYAPSLKLKIHFAQRYHNYSDREMEDAILYHLHLKRFLGVPVAFNRFDHSTLGLDRGRMGSDLFDACHHHILSLALAKGLWGKEGDRWLIDSFHTYAQYCEGRGLPTNPARNPSNYSTHQTYTIRCCIHLFYKTVLSKSF